MYDIIIIGAGASGISAALKASMIDSKLQILVLEKEAKCGRKLSASGNGKCNLTNSVFSKDCYHSIIGDLPSVFVENHNIDEVTGFFHDLGILTYDNNGYHYPISNKALQVTSALVKMCLLRGVEIINSCVVTSIKKMNDKDCYSVLAKDASYYGRNVILAAGSCASPMLGGCSLGYELAEQLGITVTDLYPGLTPIYVDDKNISLAKGVRLNGTVSLHINDIVKKETGQIQINEDNLSGIALMNLSCYLPLLNGSTIKDCLYIDIMPEYSWEKLKEFFVIQQSNNGKETVVLMLSKIFPSPFVKYLLTRIRVNADTIISELTDKQINRLVSNIKKLTFTPVYRDDYSKAQVTIGGINTKEIDSNSFESTKYKGLYIIGEMLDIAGCCGGFNITFAVLSGINAAKAITNKL